MSDADRFSDLDFVATLLLPSPNRTVFGRYPSRCMRMLVPGGMGVVWLAPGGRFDAEEIAPEATF